MLTHSNTQVVDIQASNMPFVYDHSDETLAAIYGRAGGAVKRACIQMNVPGELVREHYRDLVQTAAMFIIRYQDESAQYAFAVARRQVVKYIINQVYNGRYDKRDASKTVFRTQHSAYAQATLRASGFHRKQRRDRPVEDEAIFDEAAAARFWEKVERAFREVLAGMRTRDETYGVREQAHVLRLSCQGVSLPSIALLLDDDAEALRHRQRRGRNVLCNFLKLPAAERRQVRARGRRLLLTLDELTPAVMNGPEQFVLHHDRGCYFFARDRGKLRVAWRLTVNGRLVTRKATVPAPIGEITRDDILASVQEVTARMDAAVACL